MEDYTICDDWGEGSGLELHEKNCNEDQIGNKFYQTYHKYHIHIILTHECFVKNSWALQKEGGGLQPQVWWIPDFVSILTLLYETRLLSLSYHSQSRRNVLIKISRFEM